LIASTIVPWKGKARKGENYWRKEAAACCGCWDRDRMHAWHGFVVVNACLVKEGFIVRWTSRVNVGEVGELI
jgi:hypothetical protein